MIVWYSAWGLLAKTGFSPDVSGVLILFLWIRIFIDWADDVRVGVGKKKTEYKHPVGQTLMLRVYDGGCLWCTYVNEIHDVQQRHSPSCVWRHFAPQGDKQDKNRCADEREIHCFDKNGVKTPDGFLCLRLVDGVWPYLTRTSSRHYDQFPSTVAGATPKTTRR